MRSATLSTLLGTRGVLAVYDFGDKASMFTADNTTTPVAANDDSVGMVRDLSGNGYHLTQSNADSRPTYKAAGLASGPCVDFDGTDDYLRNTSLPSSGGELSVAFSGGGFSSGESFVWSYGDLDVAQTEYGYYSFTSSEWRLLAFDAPVLRQTNSGVEVRSSAHVVSGTITPTTVSDYKNGGAVDSVTGSSFTPEALSALYVGNDVYLSAGYYLDGPLGMMVVADVAWTAAERNRVEWALARRIGITIA